MLCWSMLLGGFYIVFFYNVHYLMILLGLELILLSILFILSSFVLESISLVSFLSFFLVLVCLGGFSISFLVSLSRGWGLDFWVKGLIF